MSASQMPTVPPIPPQRLVDLRRRAVSSLPGATGAEGISARAVDALSVLHALASSPETASDALALLHELQVHQVELDLQAQELQETRAELEAALNEQRALYECLPVGCLTIDAQLNTHDANQAAADLLGIGLEAAARAALDAFIGTDGVSRLRLALAALDDGLSRVACPLVLQPIVAADRAVLASIARAPSADRYLVCLTFVGDPQQESRRTAS